MVSSTLRRNTSIVNSEGARPTSREAETLASAFAEPQPALKAAM
jgi:hypothetical protein